MSDGITSIVFMSLLLSKEACWIPSHRYIYGIICLSRAHIPLGQILLHQITLPHKSPRLITRDISGFLFFFRGGGIVFVSARVKPHFCGACSAISCRCLGLCLLSSCFLGAGQARRRAEFASVVFGHAFSHTAFQTDLLTSTHFGIFFFFLSFPPLSPSFSPGFFCSEGNVPQNQRSPQMN